VHGDVPQTDLFDATIITDGQIDPRRPAQVRGQAGDEEVVGGADGALGSSIVAELFDRAMGPT